MSKAVYVPGAVFGDLTIIGRVPGPPSETNRRFFVECSRGHRAIKRQNGIRYGCSICNAEERAKQTRERQAKRAAAKAAKPRWTPAKYEGKTVAEWVKFYRVSKQTIHNRIKRHGTPHPPEPRAKGGWGKVIDGKTVAEWAEFYGITKGTIYYRINRYGTPHGRTAARSRAHTAAGGFQ